MGRFVQILLQPLNDMNTDGNLTIFHFGIEGWIEEWSSELGKHCQGYRIISQKNVGNIISQIVEIMPDGWVPSKIYKQDVSFIKHCTDPMTAFREALVGCWNRRMIDINIEESLEEKRAVCETATAFDSQHLPSLLGQPPLQARQHQQRHNHHQQQQQQPQKQYHQPRPLRYHNNQLLIALSPLPDQQTSSKRR